MFSHPFKANKPSTDTFHTDSWIWAVQTKIQRCFRNLIAINSKKELLFKSSKDNSGSGLSCRYNKTRNTEAGQCF